MYKSLLILTAILICDCLPAQEAPTAVLPSKHHALLKKYCFECHDADTKEGGVNLAELSFDLATMESAESWQKVLGVINAGEMPPEEEVQLTRDEKTGFLDDLSHRIVVARSILSDSGGVITMRRLNRREYANTIRDLLGVEVGVEGLPDDANPGGFDTSGGSLFLSSDQFEKYLEIAHNALDLAIATGPRPRVQKIRRQCEIPANNVIKKRSDKLLKQYNKAQRWRQTQGKKSPTEFGFIDSDRVKFEEGLYKNQFPSFDYYLNGLPQTKTGAVLLTTFGGAFLDTTTVPRNSVAGKYLLRVRAGYFPGSPKHHRFLEFGNAETDARSGEFFVAGCREVTGTIEDPSILEIPITISDEASRKIVLRQRLPNNRDAHRLDFRDARVAKKPAPDPALWLDWVEIEGPLIDHWPSVPQQKIFFSGLNTKLDQAYARKIIQRFASRAFRGKPPANRYINKLVGLYTERRAEGVSFVDAVKAPLAVILASPSFLYLVEPVGPGQATRELTNDELAVRLSYFLWSAPPDGRLLSLAKSGELGKPEVLIQQTDRLLDNPRSLEFISGFAHQWLNMDRLDFFQFNSRLFNQFDDSVKEAARQEVYQTINTLIRANDPIGKLIRSDFVVVNDLLANYYGIDGIQGHAFKKVKVPQGSPRGGLLAAAAILAMGSDGERSSPVERGAWVMRNILNDPPPPAPANVPQLSRIEESHVSARKLQKLHMEEPQCAQCHRKIDPIGFGLENFDAAGQWRDKEETFVIKRGVVKSRKSFKIDPSGALPDGATFDSFVEMRNELAKREMDLAQGFTQALIEYGLGRPYGFSDYDLSEEILEKAKVEKFGMREFIHALIQSKQFRIK